MKQQLGIVIKVDGNSAKVKINNDKEKNKIIEVKNEIDAKVGNQVVVEINKVKKVQFMYVKFIQPILLAILGIIVGHFIGIQLNQPDFVYKAICLCLFITVGLVYKDYTIEKNKITLKYNPSIIKVN